MLESRRCLARVQIHTAALRTSYLVVIAPCQRPIEQGKGGGYDRSAANPYLIHATTETDEMQNENTPPVRRFPSRMRVGEGEWTNEHLGLVFQNIEGLRLNTMSGSFAIG